MFSLGQEPVHSPASRQGEYIMSMYSNDEVLAGFAMSNRLGCGATIFVTHELPLAHLSFRLAIPMLGLLAPPDRYRERHRRRVTSSSEPIATAIGWGGYCFNGSSGHEWRG